MVPPCWQRIEDPLLLGTNPSRWRLESSTGSGSRRYRRSSVGSPGVLARRRQDRPRSATATGRPSRPGTPGDDRRALRRRRRRQRRRKLTQTRPPESRPSCDPSWRAHRLRRLPHPQARRRPRLRQRPDADERRRQRRTRTPAPRAGPSGPLRPRLAAVARAARRPARVLIARANILVIGACGDAGGRCGGCRDCGPRRPPRHRPGHSSRSSGGAGKPRPGAGQRDALTAGGKWTPAAGEGATRLAAAFRTGASWRPHRARRAACPAVRVDFLGEGGRRRGMRINADAEGPVFAPDGDTVAFTR